MRCGKRKRWSDILVQPLSRLPDRLVLDQREAGGSRNDTFVLPCSYSFLFGLYISECKVTAICRLAKSQKLAILDTISVVFGAKSIGFDAVRLSFLAQNPIGFNKN